MSSKRRRKPGDVFPDAHGDLIRVTESGGEEPFTPRPHELFPEFAPDVLAPPRRADGSIAPFYALDDAELERLGQDTPSGRRVRHDGWTAERQKLFIERLAASASVSDAARYVGMSRQSARDLYHRSPPFRDAWDAALRLSVSVLVETAFDRAVNGVQEQVFHRGKLVGFREKYNDRLLMFLLRVRDPLNFAPLSDLQGWLRHRAVEDKGGLAPALDRLQAAEAALPAGPAADPDAPEDAHT